MSSGALQPSPFQARIGGQTIDVGQGQTLLQAAQRHGVPFPANCRVGGCGTCRCRLVAGRVRELTETAYLLSAEELERGTILACQSVPLSDVTVELDRAPKATSRADVPAFQPDQARSAETTAGPLHYLKFFGFHAVGLLAAAALFAGGSSPTVALLAILAFYLLGDAICGDDISTPTYRHPGILTAQLWLALPLLSLVVLSALWGVSPGDPLGLGAWLSGLTGRDLLAARDATRAGHRLTAGILTGLMIGMVGTIPAHELTHRTWDPVSMLVGRWLLAFSFDTSFAIEHVYGHHRYVSTTVDPATAPRGRSVYHHILASTWKGNASAWRIEVDRLRKRRSEPWSHRNAVLRGGLMSLALLAGAFALGGWRAAAYLAGCALWGKALLEIVNYMEHYGMVRSPAAPVKPRHSWNTNRRISSWTLFNLTRHSHHHAQGEVPYHALRPLPGAPTMINGYLTTIVIALVPPLWHRLMTPKVLAWERDHASQEERRLASEANLRSGIPALARAAGG
jgi:ferredoxin/fatty-acid desaturase